ncbi:MAG: pyrroline-5-carboxylate reductase [Clostridiaceae bacterium]|nr:pyrroline-5-carboxylate reductase [Clostridiaceae bacterium]
MNQKIGFIGAGNMAYAIVKGLLDKFPHANENIFVSNRTLEKAESFSKSFGINMATDNKELVQQSDIIVLTVKPHICEAVLQEIKGLVNDNQMIVSIAAGVSLEYLQSFFEKPVKIVRVMTNTPVSVGEGMTFLTPNQQVVKEELDMVYTIFESIGAVDTAEEKFIAALAAISASSPAYVFMFIEALGDAGVLQGLPRKEAYRYAAQGVLGAAKMVLETEKHPGELKDMVCSPGGMTIEAVYALERNHFRSSIIEAVEVCTAKSKKLIGQ